ncbi:MAG TPA: ABC transporter substrate-binding protein [Burkholderiaceae bacterium]|jgi:branched-chain amino acid transport system substrate-binding protein
MHKNIIATAVLALTMQTAAFAADPIKLGFLTVDSGPFMNVIAHFNEPAQLAVEVLNAEGGALGRKFELVMQSHAGTPATALSAANKLVEQQGVTMFSGFFTSSMSASLAPRLAAMNVLMFDADTTSDDSIGKNCTANFFHTAGTNKMVLNAIRSEIRKSGVKTWDVIGSDYAMGHDFTTQLEPLIKAEGGTLRTQVFATLGTSDFGSHISRLAANPAEGLAIVVTGVDAVNFFKQQKQFGLMAKYKAVISSSSSLSDAVLDSMGDSSVGVVLANQWDKAMPGDGNAAFVKAFEARYKKLPTFMDADVFQAFQLMRDGIVKAKSTDAAAVRAALSGMKTNTLFGPIEVRAADHQVVRPMALQQVVAAGAGKAAIASRGVVAAADVVPPVSPECKL